MGTTVLNVEKEPQRVKRGYLVGIYTQKEAFSEAEQLIKELQELVANLEIEVVGEKIIYLREFHAKLLVGQGKADEILQEARCLECDVIIFDDTLSPAQQRNWEKSSGVAVIDRQEVILDIFAKRAQTKEAVLQVELARMEYTLPRLKRAWTHLSRQKGGSSTQRGEGEKQIELDERIVRKRIAHVKQELIEVERQREVQRKKRLSVPMPVGAIVGYTNAGKSTLLNRLTGSCVLVEDKLFATLDPTTRRLKLPGGQTLLLCDTVGFVRKLPHRLINAFKATLEEALVADFLIHVLDASSPDVEKHYETTLSVLKELGAEQKPMLLVFNKIDKISSLNRLGFMKRDHKDACWVSMVTGEGEAELMKCMEDYVLNYFTYMQLLLPYERYDVVGQLYKAGAVNREEPRDEGVYVEGFIPIRLIESLQKYRVRR